MHRQWRGWFAFGWAFLFSFLARAEEPGGGWPDLSKPAPAQGGGEKDAALVIGIGEYSDLAKVPGAAENARDWAKYMIDSRGLDPTRVFLVTDKDAYLENLQAKIDAAAAAAPSGGTLWVVYIGHGYSGQDPSDKKASGLLVGVDAKPDVRNLNARSIPQAELFKRVSKGKQASTVVILDACFSGKTPQGGFLLDTGLMVTVAAPPPEEAMKRNVPAPRQNSFLVLTATKEDEYAGPLPAARRPAFSYLILGAMRGWASNGDGVVTAEEALSYAQDALRHANDRVQTPQLKGKGSWVLALGNEPKPSPSLVATGPETPAPVIEAPKTITLAITSEPKEAEVYIDNFIKGVTPLTLYVPLGERPLNIRVGKDGFYAKDEDFVPSTDYEAKFTLEALPPEQRPTGPSTADLRDYTARAAGSVALGVVGVASGAVAGVMVSQRCGDTQPDPQIYQAAPGLAAVAGLSLGAIPMVWRESWEGTRAPALGGAASALLVAGGLLVPYRGCEEVLAVSAREVALSRAGLGLLGAGVALAIPAGVFLWKDRATPETRAARTSWRVVPTAGGAALSLSGAW